MSIPQNDSSFFQSKGNNALPPQQLSDDFETAGCEISDSRPTYFLRFENEYPDDWARHCGPFATSVYMVLCRYVDGDGGIKVWPSYETIAFYAGMSKRAAIDGVATLIRQGAILKKPRFRQNADGCIEQGSNMYYIISLRNRKPNYPDPARDVRKSHHNNGFTEARGVQVMHPPSAPPALYQDPCTKTHDSSFHKPTPPLAATGYDTNTIDPQPNDAIRELFNNSIVAPVTNDSFNRVFGLQEDGVAPPTTRATRSGATKVKAKAVADHLIVYSDAARTIMGDVGSKLHGASGVNLAKCEEWVTKFGSGPLGLKPIRVAIDMCGDGNVRSAAAIASKLQYMRDETLAVYDSQGNRTQALMPGYNNYNKQPAAAAGPQLSEEEIETNRKAKVVFDLIFYIKRREPLDKLANKLGPNVSETDFEGALRRIIRTSGTMLELPVREWLNEELIRVGRADQAGGITLDAV